MLMQAVLSLLAEIYAHARAELTDPATLRRRLLELETRHDWGDLDDETYLRETARLQDLLAASAAAAGEEAET